MTGIALVGIDGRNPLGFLAALGVALVARNIHPEIRLSWTNQQGIWRPVVDGVTADRDKFVEELFAALKGTSSEPFEIDKRLPFDVALFKSELQRAQDRSSRKDRRLADFLAAFGTEIHHDKGLFADSSFRMVRSGDAAGQGLPAYANVIRLAIDASSLRNTLFEVWSYQDDGPILRWDPLDDQRYALVWNNPEDKAKKPVKVMLGADALAIEALALFPVIPEAGSAKTTGFFRSGSRESFSWPIWDHPATINVVRSLLSRPELHATAPDRKKLAACGIVEIFRSERIAPNKYYKNFTPALPA